MILLVGGTSETAPLAAAMLEAGWPVLASMATEATLALPEHPRLERRRGRLDRDGFSELIAARGISRVVDATHPFAVEARGVLREVCEAAGVPRIRFERGTESVNMDGVDAVDGHDEAASASVAAGRPILLTTGSRNLALYVRAAAGAGVPLFARVLPADESRAAVASSGIAAGNVEYARGPFSVEETRALLRRWGIGVLVAKDAGSASGVAERLEAARAEGVRVVLVRRPPEEPGAASTPAGVLARLASLDGRA